MQLILCPSQVCPSNGSSSGDDHTERDPAHNLTRQSTLGHMAIKWTIIYPLLSLEQRQARPAHLDLAKWVHPRIPMWEARQQSPHNKFPLKPTQMNVTNVFSRYYFVRCTSGLRINLDCSARLGSKLLAQVSLHVHTQLLLLHACSRPQG